MATPMTVGAPAPTGVVATYFGTSGGTTDYYYFIQAIYPGGRSLLSTSNLVTAPASLSGSAEILVAWHAMVGAIGYNVYRAGTTTLPTVGTNFIASVTSNSYTDAGSPAISAGKVIVDGVRTARARYDFAVDAGGAPGLITLAQSDEIPDNAILVGGMIDFTTAVLAAGGAATVAIGTSAGSSASSLLAATAKASCTGVVAIVPTYAIPVKMTAAGTITFTSATNVLTAGVCDVVVTYIMPLS
jgi:hypothetical protein